MLENQPYFGDAVIGTCNPQPKGRAVLGGLAGIKQRLTYSDIKIRLAALKEALNYGKAGLNLVIQALQNESEQLQRAAYLLLLARTEPEVRPALWEFNPYRFFECVHTLSGYTGWVWSVAFSPEGKILASGSSDGNIKLWHTGTGHELLTLISQNNYPVNSVAFSPNRETIASGSGDGTIELWQLSTGRLMRSLRGHTYSVCSVAFSPDGQALAIGSADGTIKIWRCDWISSQVSDYELNHTKVKQ